MRGEFLPFAAPLLGDEEIQEVVHCLRSGWLTTGHKVKQFEREFGEFIGAKHALAVNSCTAALHLALEAVGVGPGDEVITTPMTFTATAAVIEHLGARPVFADVTARTLNIDPEQIRRRLSPRTKAILPVHFAGQACDMDAIVDIARGAGVPVIEDAAHAIPTRYNGRMVGTLSDITCFSFYATKNVTTGEGGMVVTDRDDIMERMRLMHLHGMSKDAWKRYTQNGSWSYEILAPGFKYNLTDIAAAIGIHQLRKCQAFHRRRLTIADQYDAAFADLPGISIPRVEDRESHGWHLYVIQVDPERLTLGRDAFIDQLIARNIGVSVHFIPLHVHPYYRERYALRPQDFPNAWGAYERIVSLPIYAKMSDDDVRHVIDAVRGIAQGAGR
ncbi:MAG TPA: DegT/DnrJ/EryC1/StrS family aminotransferase [Verrucomicrobiae bacterium]|jgi:dTDP-4-amino-4,6-dideoxygalactose transaminase|nr:DegT/DnrJ/EryC1/StrS family aminotransferase [Verrucomicrobiae bacterium]